MPLLIEAPTPDALPPAVRFPPLGTSPITHLPAWAKSIVSPFTRPLFPSQYVAAGERSLSAGPLRVETAPFSDPDLLAALAGIAECGPIRQAVTYPRVPNGQAPVANLVGLHDAFVLPAELFDALIARGWVIRGGAITESGHAALTALADG